MRSRAANSATLVLTKSWERDRSMGMPPSARMTTPTDEDIARMAKARIGYKTHAMAYVAVNLLLVAIWAFSGDDTSTTVTMGDMSFTDRERAPFYLIRVITPDGRRLDIYADARTGREIPPREIRNYRY